MRRSRFGTTRACSPAPRHVPGVGFAGLIHPGLIGTLPDKKLLAAWNAREQALIDTNPTRVPPLANPPFAKTAHLGKLTGDAKAKAAAEGARTVPPREHGGQLRHQRLVARLDGLFSGLRSGCRSLDGRHAFQPRRRRNHLLRGYRDVRRVAAHPCQSDQGRHGEVRASRTRSSSHRPSRRTTKTI